MSPRVQGFRLAIYVFKDAEIVDFAAPYGVFSVCQGGRCRSDHHGRRPRHEHLRRSSQRLLGAPGDAHLAELLVLEVGEGEAAPGRDH